MAGDDPEPNDNVSLAGSGVLLHVQRADGALVPVRGTTDGAVTTTGVDGASPVALLQVNDTGTPVVVDKYPGVEVAENAVAVGVMNVVVTTPDPQTLFAGAVPSNAQATAVRLVDGTGVQITNVPAVTARQGAAGSEDWKVYDATTKGAIDDLTTSLSDHATEGTLTALLERKLAERLTGYGEQRVAARHEIFQFTAGTIEDTEILGFVGTGTHGIDAARRAQYIAVDGTNGQSQALQSNTNYPFPPSVPFAVYGVVQFSDAGVIGQVRRVQVGADDDYLGLQFDGTDASIEILSALSGVPVSIPRASWLDPLDGTGASAYTIDWTTPNTIEIVSGSPGANAGFASINGIKILDLPAYLNVAGVMKRSMKPVRAIIYNTAAASPGTIYVRGFSIYALGSYRLPVRVRSAPASPVTRSMSTVLSPLIAVRVKSTLGGEPYRGLCYPKQLTITNRSSSAILDVILYRNPTSLTGASWTDVSPRSGIQVDTSATAADLTGASALYVDVVQSSSARTIDLTAVFEEHLSNLIRNRVDGLSDVVVVMCATSISNSDVRAGFVLDEVPG